MTENSKFKCLKIYRNQLPIFDIFSINFFKNFDMTINQHILKIHLKIKNRIRYINRL